MSARETGDLRRRTCALKDEVARLRAARHQARAQRGAEAGPADETAFGRGFGREPARIATVPPGGLNGRRMVDAARRHRPDLKVLFITGYAENATFGNGQLEPGMRMIAKPVPAQALAARVRAMSAGLD